MAVTATDLDTLGGPALVRRPAARARRLLRRQPTFAAGVVVLLLMLVAGVLAPLWWTGDPLQMKPAQRLRPPSAERWFGSDHFGRDVYTRTVYGARVSLTVGASVALLSLALGTTLGLVIGFYRRLDTVIMRVMDGLMPSRRSCWRWPSWR